MANYLIIAGTSAIARSLIEKLLAQAHQVFITGRDLAKTEALAKQLTIPFCIADAANFSDVDQAFAKAQESLGPLDGVVNFAGSLLLKPAHASTQSDYENVIAANLTTAFAVVRSAGKYMKERGGSVVLLSSAAALTGLANHEAIAAAKAGIQGLTLSAAATYATNQIRFNAVAPGLVETPLSENLTSNPLMRKASEAMHPLGRIGKPEDIAAALAFFLDPANDWITGQVLAVDGGLSQVHPKAKV